MSERKQADRALRESEERWRLLVDNHPEAILVSVAGRIVFVNRAGAELAGRVSSESVLGRPLADFVSAEDMGLFERWRRAVERGEMLAPAEYSLIRLDGEERRMEAMAVPVTYNDRRAVQIVLRDVTERRRYEEGLIAARDEEQWITAAIRSALAAGANEVIVADGASTDRTRELAAAAGATVLSCEPMRSKQFNRGAAAARHETLIFLHADTMLPPGAADAVRGRKFGGFRLRFAEPSRRLRFVAFLANLRTSMTRCPWGDQAQFIPRSDFDGFLEIPIMEDYELAVRMKRRGGNVLLPLTVTTSGRRFLERGVVRTTILNWMIIIAWRLGVPPDVLARWYRG